MFMRSRLQKKRMCRKRIRAHALLDEGGQPVDGLSQIRGPGQINALRAREAQHGGGAPAPLFFLDHEATSNFTRLDSFSHGFRQCYRWVRFDVYGKRETIITATRCKSLPRSLRRGCIQQITTTQPFLGRHVAASAQMAPSPCTPATGGG